MLESFVGIQFAINHPRPDQLDIEIEHRIDFGDKIENITIGRQLHAGTGKQVKSIDGN